MLKKILDTLAPPIESEFYRSRLQTNLRAILIILIAAFSLAFLFNDGAESRIAIGGMIVFLSVVFWFFTNGDMLLARIASPLIGYVSISYLIFNGLGIQSVTVPALWTLIVCARALGSGTSAVIYTGLSMVTLAAAYQLEHMGIMIDSPDLEPSSLQDLTNLYIELVALAAAVWFLSKNIEDDRDIAIESRRKMEINEQQLGEKDHLYRLLADNAQDLIWTADLELNYTYLSPSSARILGYTPSELIGKSIFFSLFPEEAIEQYRDVFRQEMQTIQDGGSPRDRHAFPEIQVMRKDGSVAWLDAQVSFLRDDNANIVGVVGTSRDISDRIQAETKAREVSDQLRQAQKIDSIGQLAGGIAHDFNNMLVAIQGYSDLAAKHKSTPEDVKRYVSEIKKAAVRAENLTRQLLTFSRRQAMESKPISANTLLLDLQDMLSRLIPANVRVDLQLAEEDHEILGDSGQLEQLIVNLCVNARDAMPGGGVLTVRSACVRLSEEEARKHPNAVAGDYVQLSVEDNGIGMEPDLQKRIFEPFFTTKKEGQGTGLGLSVVHGVVVEHGGYITVDSEENVGTTIRVHVPKSDTVTASRSLIEINDIVPGGKETVLVVEDEEQVRDLATLVLSQAGYTVLTAADGMLGWELFLSQRDNIALIVCDVVMPNMGGRQLLRLVREIDEAVPFIFTSGYVGGPDPKNFAERYAVEFLQKPFSASSLQQKVRGTLDTRVERKPRQRQVLAVDDNSSILHLLELDVQELGHEILTAGSGEEAVQLCEDQEFDIIFMDIQMQGMNGIDATRIIRQRSEGQPRIIGLTAHYTEEERERCLEAGMDEVITKPIRFDRLTRLLGGKHNEDDASPQPNDKPTPVFDLDVSLHLANNRTDVAEEMFGILLSKLPEDQKAINDAFNRNDIDDFRMQVHKLNGAVRYCGVPALSEAINQLETLAKGSEIDEIKDAMNEANERVEELIGWEKANPNPFNLHRIESGY